jgi:putative toxin-antitoxin system antitoxin component (TIGR02293 family)
MTETVEKALSYLGEKPKKAKSRAGRDSDSRRPVELGGHLKLRAPQVSSRAVGRLAEKLAVSELVVLNVSDISARTFQRRRERQEPLSEAESDRVLRIARIANEAERVFGDSGKARRWLSADNRILGAKPLDLLATDAGAREVEAELIRIDFGDFS